MIGTYYRLSLADEDVGADKAESNSIYTLNPSSQYSLDIQVLLEANGLAAGKDHQFKGRYDAEKNAVIISLEKDEQSALSPQKCTT